MRKSLHNLTGSFKLIDILKPINFKKEVVVILLFLLCYSSSLLGQVQVVTDPTEVMVSLNETFTVTVEVNTDQSVDATEIHMGFDPNIIEVVSVSLPQSNPLPVPIIEADFDNILGTLDYVAGTFSNFPNSNFVFLEIEFIAQALGTTELEFTGLPSKVTYGGSNILSGLSGTNITIIPSGPDSSPTIALIEDVIVTEGSSIEKDIYITDDKNVYNTNIVIYDKSNGGSNSPFLPSTTVSENNYSLLDNGNGNYTFNWNTVLGDGRSYLAEVTTDDGVNLPVKQTFTIDIAQKIPSDILARTFTNPLPWYKSTSDTPPVAPFTVAIEDNAAQNVGYLDPADYIEYLIDVPAPGEYDIELLAAKGNNGATMVSISEENNNSYSTIGTFNVIKTAWQVYNSYSTTVTFTNAGLQTIRFDFDGGVNIKNFIVSQSQITACNTAFRVNAGGPLFGLTGGDFEADQSANQAGGTAETGTPSIYYKGAIDKTFGSNAPLVSNNTGYPDVIFQTERHIEGGTLMNWEFPANGTYEVDLLFNENWTGENANPRVFDVEIEGDLVLDDYRPSVAAGGVNIAKVETFTVEVEDGIMNIDFIQGTQNPSIKGFSICLISEPDNTAPIVTINSPSEGNTLVRGMNVDLIGTALDSEDGDISDSINWSSNDTRFTTMPLNGIGSNINGMFVTPGIQTLTASVSDSDSESSSSEIEIEVSGPAVSIVAPLDSEELYSTNVRLEWSGTDVLFDLTEHYHLYINPPDISNIDTATRISTASQIGQEFWELNELDGIVEGLNTIVVVVADPTHAEFVNSEAKDVINFTVSLQDVTSPIITLLDTDPLQIELGSPYINLGASASDDLDGDLTDEIIIGGDVVDVNTIGNYIITYNVLDEAGNLATEVTQTVTVSDNVAPIITCPADIITSTTQGICGVNLNISGISAIDLSDEITYESTRSDGLLMSEPYSLGETTITWTALDASGNMSESCVQTITVTDEVGPGFDCPVNISATSLNGNPMVLEIVTPSVFDSCSELDVILTSTRNDGLELDDAFPVGETQIEWKALDNANNLISCIQTVTVNYAGSSENTIVFFSFEEQSEPEIIDYSSGTVEISVVAGTDLTTLEPNFGISSNASVNPNLGDVMDFTNPVNYTVTAEDGSQKIWTIVVKVDDDNNHLSINAFTLINADTGQDIMILIEGQLINAANYVNTNLAIRADTSSDVGSVQLMLSGDKTKNQTESLAPFSLYGDDVLTGDYGGELFAIGSYTITATPYINAGLTGEQGETKSVNFQFIDQDPICINFDASIANKVNPSGCNNNDGSIVINTIGFEGSLSYNWSHDNNLDSSTAISLEAGVYSVTVTDSNGCYENLSITLDEPELPSVTLEPFSDILVTDSPINLIGGMPLGGEYTGLGVNENVFDPSIGVGEYSITYNYIDSNGCSNSISNSIQVLNAPIDNATLFVLNADNDSQLYVLTDGLQITKSDIGNTPLGIIYNADLNPGNVTFKLTGPVNQNKSEGPSAPYSLFGDIGVDIQGKEFPVGNYTLAVSTSSGVSQTVSFSVVSGPPVNMPPLVSLSGNVDGSVPFKVNFTSTGSTDGDGNIMGYLWNFGDGNTSDEQNPSHTYATGGDYDVSLTLTDDDNATGTERISVTAVDPTINQLPNAVVNASPTNGTFPLTVEFSSSGSFDPDGNIVMYEWDFGDGSISTQTNPDHIFTNDGDFMVTLTVTDNEGAIDTSSINIAVNAPMDNATLFVLNADNDSQLYVLTDGLQITKSDIGNTPLGIIYNADLNPGNVTFKLTGPVNQNKSEGPSAPYSLFGDIGVDIQGKQFPIGDYTLATTTSSGESQTVSFSVVSGPPANMPPLVSLSGNVDGSVPFKVNFTSTGSTDGDGNITGFLWNFGDGNTSDEQNPSHTYATGGDYDVSLTLTDDDNATGTESISVTAVDPTINQLPNAVVNASTTNGTFPLTVEFSSTGSFDPDGNIVMYEWDFGDGSISTQTNPDHIFTNDGDFMVTLTVTDNEGAIDTSSINIAVNAPIDNATLFVLNADNDSQLYVLTDGLQITKSDIGNTPLGIIYNADLNPGNVTFNLTGPVNQNKSEGPSAPYSLFGDIGVDIQGKEFPVGNYTLAVTTSSGVSQTVSFTVVSGPPVNMPPLVSLSGNVDGSVPFKVNFTSTGSTDGDGNITGYLWDFGDGNTSDEQNPSHTYATGGDYDVSLTLTDDDNATGTESISVTAVDPSDIDKVISFTLMNATDQSELFEIHNNMNINTTDAIDVNIRANTDPGIVGSVKFELSGTLNRTWIETNSPYALYGDFNGEFMPTTFPLGSYTLKAIPYAIGGALGEIGQSLTVKFNVILAVSTAKTVETTMSIFPNPASESITVSFDEPTSLTQIYIYDITGKLVQILKMNDSQDVGTYLIGVQDLPTGSYFVRTIDSEGKQSQQQMAIKR